MLTSKPKHQTDYLSPLSKPYLTITNEDREKNQQQAHTVRPYPDYEASREDEYEPTAAENVPQVNRKNRTEPIENKTERVEDQTEAETSQISVPKSLSNLRQMKDAFVKLRNYYIPNVIPCR